jgi:hypothetical protein
MLLHLGVAVDGRPYGCASRFPSLPLAYQTELSRGSSNDPKSKIGLLFEHVTMITAQTTTFLRSRGIRGRLVNRRRLLSAPQR